MPFIEGESLRERLRRENRLSVDEALRITREVASALEYAHARRVVHRDIKPENILLSTSGHAFVADFGVAYALDEARSAAHTDPGFAVGTLAYMSPEEMEGERELDGRADLYSLACVLYEMLVGTRPFSGPSLAARSVIPSVLSSRAEVPAAVDRAIRHALAMVPEQRYATLAEFTAALRHASRFEISTLGGLTIRADGRPLRGDRLAPHALACLALLAHAGDRGVPRERLETFLGEGLPPAESSSRMVENTLAAIRSELGPADVLMGDRVIQLDPSLVDSDVNRFTAMIRDERLADAVGEYHGPFLHGFVLAQAPAFARWVERTSAELAFEYAIALERLARDTEARGEYADAVRWWRKLVGQDPLNGRLTVGLMQALAAAGDRAGAIEQASIYEVLIDEDVELPPDRGVVAFAERLRAGWHPGDAELGQGPSDSSGASRATAPLGTMQPRSNGKSATTSAVIAPAPTSPTSPESSSRDQRWRRAGLVVAIVTLLLAALWLLGARPIHPPPHATPAPNDRSAPGREAGATRPPSGIGAR